MYGYDTEHIECIVNIFIYVLNMLQTNDKRIVKVM